MNNPIIDEVRAARAALAKEHGYDRGRILEWARMRQTELEAERGRPATVSVRPDPDDAPMGGCGKH